MKKKKLQYDCNLQFYIIWTHLFLISDIYNFRETAGCSVASGLYPKFHEAIFLITLKYTFYF